MDVTWKHRVWIVPRVEPDRKRAVWWCLAVPVRLWSAYQQFSFWRLTD